MGTLYQQVGHRIGELRRAKGWTQEKLAEVVGRNPSYLARIESGARQATISTLDAIAKALDVPVGALFPRPTTAVPIELAAAIDGLDRQDLLLLAEVARRFERRKRRTVR